MKPLERSKALILLVASTTLFCSCGSKEQTKTVSAAANRPAAPVVVATAEQQDIPVQIHAIGNVEAYQTVFIRSQVNGQIQKIFFKEGDDVREGQLLFQLDKRPFQAELERAAGQLKRDQAQAENSRLQKIFFKEGDDVREGQLLFQLDKRPFQAELERAAGQLKRDQAQAENSRLQAERYSDLEKQGIVAREQADQLRAQAKAEGAAVEADKAALEAARVQLQYADILAPISARAGVLMINLGNLVKANDTPYLVQLNQVSPIYVTFSVPEGNLDRVRQRYGCGQLKVLALPKGQADHPVEGKLTFIDNGVDTTTGMFKLKATFQNRNRRLWPGQFVDVALELSTQKNAIVIPTKAIQNGQQGDYVYVVRADSTAESRVVKQVGTYQDLTLISNGLRAGEQVVVHGHMRVVPNSKVIVQSTIPTQTNAAANGASTGGG